MLDINIPTSPLPTLIKPKAFAEKSLETVKVILHNTLIVIAMQTVVLLQFYIFFLVKACLLWQNLGKQPWTSLPKICFDGQQAKNLKGKYKEAHLHRKVTRCKFSKNKHSHRNFPRALPTSKVSLYIAKLKNSILQSLILSSKQCQRFNLI